LEKPIVQEKVKELMMAASQKLGITRERVMQEMGRIAFSDLRNFFDENGNLKNISDLGDAEAAALSSIEVEEGKAGVSETGVVMCHTKKLKLWDKVKNLEMLAKHFKIFEDNGQPVNLNFKIIFE
jgi:phage terminase small subunit